MIGFETAKLYMTKIMFHMHKTVNTTDFCPMQNFLYVTWKEQYDNTIDSVHSFIVLAA